MSARLSKPFFVSPESRAWLSACLTAAVLLLSSVSSLYASGSGLQPAAVQSLLPQDTEVLLSADVPWWWDASSSIRQQPDVVKILNRFELKTGLSIQNDIAPWIGETSVALMRTGDKNPQFAVCAQVRDLPAFLGFVAKLKAHPAVKGAPVWTESAYGGVPLEVTTLTFDPGHKIVVKIGMLSGWVVAGFGDKTVERVIDTYSGQSPSLLANPAWSKALAHLPAQHAVWGGIDYGRLMADIVKEDPKAFPPSQMQSLQMIQMVYAGSMADTGNGLRFDGAIYPTSDAGRRYMQLFAVSSPVTGGVLTHLPNHANIAYVFSNPAKWRHSIVAGMTAMATPQEKRQLAKSLDGMKPLMDTINLLTGEAGFALTWQDGYGAVAAAQAASPAAANLAARKIAAAAHQGKMKVMRSGNTWKIAAAGSSGASQFYAPTWTVNRDWLIWSSSPGLLHAPVGKPELQIPTEARGANMAALGNFRGLTDLAGMFFSDPSNPGSQIALSAIRGLDLDPVSWSTWSVYHPDDSWVQGAFVVQNWNWREVIANEIKVIDQARKTRKTSPKKGPSSKKPVDI